MSLSNLQRITYPTFAGSLINVLSCKSFNLANPASDNGSNFKNIFSTKFGIQSAPTHERGYLLDYLKIIFPLIFVLLKH